MKLGTRIVVAMSLSVILALMGAAFLAADLRVTRNMVRETARLNKIVAGLYELRILSLEYEKTPLERSARQWRAMYGELAGELSSEEGIRPEIMEAFTNAGTSFEKIALSAEPPSGSRSLGEKARTQRFASLHVEMQRIIDWARRDADDEGTLLVDGQRRAATGIVVALAAIMLLALIVISRLGRYLLSSIRILENGTSLIAKGDLANRISIRGDDEMAALAAAFNAMAENLESSYSSLESKNAELERFTYTVSHDLKSPLITIRGFLGYLVEDAEQGDAERLRADVGRITLAAAKMENLLGDLLSLSRIGRIANPPERFPMRDAFDEAISRTEGAIGERGASVEIGDMPDTFADRERIVEVWQNLLENAIKYSRVEGPARMEAGSERRGDSTVFFLRDNGIGIDPKYRERVFGLFEKIDARSEGTGIGLALVKRIVEIHGGKIWVESGIDGGSTFLFTLNAEEGGGDERSQ